MIRINSIKDQRSFLIMIFLRLGCQINSKAKPKSLAHFITVMHLLLSYSTKICMLTLKVAFKYNLQLLYTKNLNRNKDPTYSVKQLKFPTNWIFLISI